jgi:AcrR family transcriptional regulator
MPGADAVPKRAYRSPLRDQQVRTTRRSVVTAAHDLFVERGYASTTIDAVAERAGVSRKTVFTAVGGKAVLLDRALDLALRGDEDPTPVAERPEIRAEAEETDPRRLVQRWTRRMAVIERRAARLALVLAAGADRDPEVAALHERSERGRRAAAHHFAARLAEIDGLRPGVDVERAGVVAAIVSEPLVFQRLVVEAGWSVAEYARWMEQTLVDSLLPR